MKPAAYSVASTAGPMLFLDHSRAEHKAIVHRSSITPLYSPEQIASMVEKKFFEPTAEDIVDFIRTLMEVQS